MDYLPQIHLIAIFVMTLVLERVMMGGVFVELQLQMCLTLPIMS